MKRKNRSVRMRRGQSLMPFERGLERPLQCTPQMRNSRRRLDTPGTKGNTLRPFRKMGGSQSVTISAKRT